MSRRAGVWEGRFQPIHLGHIAYIKKIREMCDELWIYVLANQTSDMMPGMQLPLGDFSRLVDPHHAQEKNPLPHYLRFKLVVETLKYELGDTDGIFVSMGGRIDLNWQFYQQALPANRVFLTPMRDSFEDAKAAAWQAIGECCERVDVSDLPSFAATDVRNALRGGHPQEAARFISPKTLEILAAESSWWNG